MLKKKIKKIDCLKNKKSLHFIAFHFVMSWGSSPFHFRNVLCNFRDCRNQCLASLVTDTGTGACPES